MNMKKTNNNSPMKRIAASATMLAVSAAMLGTSTYAWFTMNKEVEVTGLTMKTKVGANLLISENNVEGDYSANRMVSGRKALLEPVSTISGKTGEFFYTLDAKASGQKDHAATDTGKAYVAYSEAKTPADGTATNTNSTCAAAGKYYYDDAFTRAYGVAPSTDEYGTAYGYVDYVFYLKATGDQADQQLRMTACDLNYTYPSGVTLPDGTTAVDADVDNAWRIAVFASDITANGGKGNSGAAGSTGDTIGKLDPAASAARSILAPTGAVNWEAGKAVKDATHTDSVLTPGTAVVIDNDIDSGVTKYYKVLVRVWLEGEDKSCNSSTYAKLTDAWSLDLEFQLTDATETATGKTAVTAITQNGFTPSINDTKNAVGDPVDVNRA
jgi:hypothetical protein